MFLVRERKSEYCFFTVVPALVTVADMGQKDATLPSSSLSRMNLDNLAYLWDTLRFLFPHNNFIFFVFFSCRSVLCPVFCRKMCIYGLSAWLVIGIAVCSSTLTLCIFLVSEKIVNFYIIACLIFVIICLFKS